MFSIRKLPIRRKIILITMLSSVLALLLAAAEMFLYDSVQLRSELEASIKAVAAITADNAMSAVSFDDEKTALDALNALQSDPLVVGGCVYDMSNVLAKYSRRAQEECPAVPRGDGISFEQANIVIVQPVRSAEGKRIGSVRLIGSLDPLRARLTRDLRNIAAVILVAMGFAFVLSSWLQRWISGPLLALTQTAKSVSETADYSIRAPKQTADELGHLVDSVNDMLSEIQSRHAEREQTMHERERLLFREQELRRQAEETNRLKDEFLAVLSHELRTPLTAIVGWAALLRAGKLAPDKIQKGLETIDRNAQEQGRLINDLLDVSGIISGKIGLNWASANAQRILKAAVDTIRPAADLKRIVVSLDEATEPAQLECDPNRLLQAFGNILSNAVKFTQNGGRIGIDVHASAEQVCITITDSGIGIPADFLPYVFDRFRQADSSSTRHYGGLGLGLSISRNIVELHGGVIRASSDGPNRGASFTIELPRSRAYLREA